MKSIFYLLQPAANSTNGGSIENEDEKAVDINISSAFQIFMDKQ